MKHIKSINEFFYYQYKQKEFRSFEEFKSFFESNREIFTDCRWDILPNAYDHFLNQSISDADRPEKYFNRHLKNGSFVIVYDPNSTSQLVGCFKDENGEFVEDTCFACDNSKPSIEDFKHNYKYALAMENN